MKTTSDTAMENIAVYDALEREGFSENILDRVERAVNAYDDNQHTIVALLDMLKQISGIVDANPEIPELIGQLAKDAITQADTSTSAIEKQGRK